MNGSQEPWKRKKDESNLRKRTVFSKKIRIVSKRYKTSSPVQRAIFSEID